MKRVFLTNQDKINFKFEQRVDTFKVTENSSIRIAKRGDFRLIKVTKRSISTMELIEYLSSVLKVQKYEIGYAGLKDKHATSIQYITLPKNINFKKFKDSNRVKLKEVGLCQNRLRIGDLISNTFEIVLEDISNSEYIKLKNAFYKIEKLGFANFFGYQRFGTFDESSKKGKKISEIGKGSKNQNSKILLAAYQAKAFNIWLNRRLELSYNIINNIEDRLLNILSPSLLNSLKKSNSLFKLLPGDLGYFYKKGKKEFKIVNNINKYTNSFLLKNYHVTGVLFGSNIRYSTSIAGKIEREYIDYSFNALRGARRVAWVWIDDANIKYNRDKHEAILKFTLPPGSYATVLIEELLNKSLIT